MDGCSIVDAVISVGVYFKGVCYIAVCLRMPRQFVMEYDVRDRDITSLLAHALTWM